jgi:hypothetical protein
LLVRKRRAKPRSRFRDHVLSRYDDLILQLMSLPLELVQSSKPFHIIQFYIRHFIIPAR